MPKYFLKESKTIKKVQKTLCLSPLEGNFSDTDSTLSTLIPPSKALLALNWDVSTEANFVPTHEIECVLEKKPEVPSK